MARLSSSHALCAASIPLFVLAASLPGCGSGEEAYDEAWIAQSGWPVHTVCAQGSTTTFGIDVSKWQSTIDWPSVKADGVVFAIVRVSDGTQNLDEQFAANWQGTKAAGIIRGPYQYFRPAQSATAQAELFVTQIEQAGGFESGDLPGVIDVETTDGVSESDAIQAVQTWIDYVESHTGRRPIIYTGSYFWDDNVVGNNFSDYPLWTAHYTSAACPLVSDAWDHWTFWQYTSSGSVSGISGNVDEDVFDGSLADLEAFIADSVIGGGEDAGMDAPSDSNVAPDVQEDAVADAGSDVEAGELDVGEDAAADAPAPDADPPAKPSISTYQSEEPDGCACRIADGKRDGAPGWWVLALVGLGLMRRRVR